VFVSRKKADLISSEARNKVLEEVLISSEARNKVLEEVLISSEARNKVLERSERFLFIW